MSATPGGSLVFQAVNEVEKNAARLIKERVISAAQKEKISLFLKTVPNLLFTEEKIGFLKDNTKDNIILECAVAAEVNLIVTMDAYLLKLKRFRNIGIIHPKTLFYSLSGK